MAAPEPQALRLPAKPAAPLPGDTACRRQRNFRLLRGFPVTIAILLLAGVVVTLFITRWDV
jgi:hypothetical protein